MLLSDRKIAVFMQLNRHESTMHKAVKSILEQTYKNFIFAIFVSNATKDTITKYARKDNRIIVVDGTELTTNHSYFQKQIDIVRENNCDYIARIDGDDWVDQRYIEKMLEFAEKHETDIVACGTYFVDNSGSRILGDRKINEMVWDTRNTTVNELRWCYRFFGTTWAKLIAADVFINQNIDNFPESDDYGRYGGDTIWVFNLLPETKRLGVCSNALYYYRQSSANMSNDSNVLHKNRIKSDEFLFNFVSDVLDRIGCLNTETRKFLLLIYATAIRDTMELVLNKNIPEADKIEKLLCIFENPLTIEFLEKEKFNQMTQFEGEDNNLYRKIYYNLIYNYSCGHLFSDSVFGGYLKILELIFPRIKNSLSINECKLLMSKKTLLDKFVCEDYTALFSSLIDELPKQKTNPNICLALLKRLTNDVILQFALQDYDFTKQYGELIKNVQQKNYNEVYITLHQYFASGNKVNYDVKLAEFWSNIGAQEGNTNEFILAKEFLVEALINNKNISLAQEEYNELVKLGVDGENMLFLSEKIKENQ